MTFIATFIALAIGGMIDAGYLNYAHRRAQPLSCPLDHDCSIVTESKWARTLGVRNEIWGLLFYAGMLFGMLGTLFVPAYREIIYQLLLMAAASGLAFSIYLSYVQFAVIKDYCFYCLISTVLTLLLFLNSLYLYGNI